MDMSAPTLDTAKECGQEKAGDCQLNSGPFFQCCCNCKKHLQDNHHCTLDTELRAKEGGCVCSIKKGWVCIGLWVEGDGQGRVHSGWPEHSCGCEMYDPIKDIERPAWAACCSESENCRRNNADIRGCCSLG